MHTQAASSMFEHGRGIILQGYVRTRKHFRDLLADQAITSTYIEHVNLCLRGDRGQPEHLLQQRTAHVVVRYVALDPIIYILPRMPVMRTNGSVAEVGHGVNLARKAQ